ncbi:MAG: hypothetical protein NC097_05470 [Clostridium sp.]|nr:hypothetical protein [Clostridium sp.]MCM1475741.1 hypothetical protein [Muribaculaceae bacterium]
MVAIMLVAQTYHGPLLYDAKGNVKEIKTKSKTPETVKKVKFDQEGMINRSMMMYDRQGYPIGYNMKFGKISMSLNIFYNSEMQPDSITYTTPSNSGPFTIEFIRNYDEGVVKSMLYRVKDNPTTKSYEFYYSGEKYDSVGNWIERQVHEICHDPVDNKTEEKDYIDTREIKYW